MRIIIIPDSPEAWLIILAVIVIIAGAVFYSWLRPPAWKKLLQDQRYCQALNVYADTVQSQDCLGDVRRHALATGTSFLTNEHGIPAEEAARNLRLVVAQYARDQSYALRQEAVAFEQDGHYDQALDHYQRAAWWQEDHDPKDYQFLQRCVARVRSKAGSS